MEPWPGSSLDKVFHRQWYFCILYILFVNGSLLCFWPQGKSEPFLENHNRDKSIEQEPCYGRIYFPLRRFLTDASDWTLQRAPPSQNQIQTRPKLWKSSMNSLNVGRFFAAFCSAICSGPMIITPVDDLGLEFSQVTSITVKFASLLWRIFKMMFNQNSISRLDFRVNQSELST